MNKTVKGAVALGAAAFILLGGAGTVAYWSSAEAVDAGTVSTGYLKFVPDAPAGTWVDLTNGGTAAIADIDTFNIVPGDKVQYTRSFTVDAEGNNLVATVGTSGLAVDPEIDQYVNASVAVTDATTGTALTSITDENDGDVVKVTVTVEFKATAILAQGADSAVDLSKLQVTLTQSQGPATGNTA